MKRLGGFEAMLLYSETRNLMQHTMKIGVLDASECDVAFTPDLFRDRLARRLHLLDPFRYQLVDIPFRIHRPMWVENVDVDLDYHVRRYSINPPGGPRELDAAIADIASTPLDRQRPLWEFHLVEGLADNKVAIVGKIHHVLADGVASANLLALALDEQAMIEGEANLVPVNPPPSGPELVKAAVRDHARQLVGVPDLLRYTADGIRSVRRNRRIVPGLARTFGAPVTFLNHTVAPTRSFASATLPLADVKLTSKVLGGTINDLVLAIATGALRALLIKYDGSATEPLLALVPRSLNNSPERIFGNDFATMIVSLPVHVGDPVERMRLARAGAAIAKSNHEALGPDIVNRWADYIPAFLARPVLQRLSTRESHNRMANVSISNVPGPRERGTVIGAPLEQIYSVGPLTPGSGINITVWSYVDQLSISVIEDGVTVEDPHVITDAMLHEFRVLRRAAGLEDS
ncbi:MULTISPECIES: wax ester/triacylglycerol synthase family O-acyltransferase [unclassified Mycobacterium]|uniref:WS/DGAT/MGAT family O-acyltransferase n=1 Tax=unclassified Mycobacterium TaxID=2642494 RepID=UPI00048B21C1|nr:MULTISPECIES: wax ester/triacylglycerol synthase family O-acyltransferase [unclassified Mycobacterium]SEA61602.1 diacylglycerol O-acyltransferase [Mycobacterium sp. 283mftsu]